MVTLLPLVLLGARLAGAPASAPTEVTVPLEILRTRHIVVATKINGGGPFRLVLDTGAPITFINRKVAVKLGLMTEEAAKRPVMMGMGGQIKAKSLEVGGAKAADVPVMILDHPIVEMIGQVEGGIDGIVGYTFWSRFRMTLDYQAKEARFEPSAYKPQDVMASVLNRLLRTDDSPAVIEPGGIWGMKAEHADNAVVVTNVTPGWPAVQGGIRVGDRIQSVNRRWTDTMSDLAHALSFARPNEPAEVVVLRSGKQVTLQVRPRPGL